MFAQGDILLIPISDGATDGLVPVRRDDHGRVILALGEVTGHAHAIHGRAVLYADTGSNGGGNGLSIQLLRVEEPVEVVHEEHAPVALAPGLYEVRRQREWSDADEPIQVVD